MNIPYESVSSETLTCILEEYASREGTEYGDHDYSIEEKVAQLYAQLKRGDIGLTFDPNTETCTLVSLR